ncbi:SDR family NAD(P)-dependent oxidoreductase [Shewanella sp. Isolate11]|uniref:SDR family NAD(P)-dependent oxidoreductase n=1 Tax=Shewanella sp. Isolate11 TaxID=2908530 RepID=UPI001EFC6BB8|nr:SDR family NAD(P)-dependent oxidoreductase [Shewanella sp. Isolate11]MCG9697082.1 SDR family NAD(P)-dependent oxidoreductase [Shewanella sp. Isolate11]
MKTTHATQKNILITGATSGIGEALTKAYVSQGHHVIACGRSQSKLAQLASAKPAQSQVEQGTEQGRISHLCFDLTGFEAYPQLSAEQGELDLLILNAGDCEYIDDALNFDAKKFERVIQINLISVGYALQAWLSAIKPGGRLVLVSSSAQMLALPRAEAYGASKAALTYLAKVLAVDLAQHDIEVSWVHPGFVETPLTDRNNFAMPMIVSPQQAAEHIISGLEKGKREICFPRHFIFIMRVLSWLPFSLWRRLARRMTKA